MEDAEMLKNVVRHSVATAFAIIVFPVPGGPKRRMPFHGDSKPVNNLRASAIGQAGLTGGI
jgi:hypothetical protein